ncbi:MAG: hypothetical protein AVDCRST_MAG08-3450, partial [uncultured Acetobacteraceae bacterium]
GRRRDDAREEGSPPEIPSHRAAAPRSAPHRSPAARGRAEPPRALRRHGSRAAPRSGAPRGPLGAAERDGGRGPGGDRAARGRGQAPRRGGGAQV